MGNQNIQLIEFDPSSRYLIVGTSKGRVLQYLYNSPFLLSRLYSFPHKNSTNCLKNKNFVTTFAFYKQKIACSGCRGSVFVADLVSKNDTKMVVCGYQDINILHFLDSSTLLGIDINNYINIISINDKNIYKKVLIPFEEKIKKISTTPNQNYIVISSDKNSCLFNTTTYKLTNINHKDTNNNQNNFKLLNSFISREMFEEAFWLILNKEILKNSLEHKKLEKIYADKYKKAINLLMVQKDKDAISMLEKFKNVKQKKIEISSLFKDFRHYKEFQNYCIEGKLSLVFAMVQKYPSLKRTTQYKEIQTTYNKNIQKAQKQLLAKNDKKMRFYLEQYISIPSKQQSIKHFITKNKDFIAFLKAIKNRDYKTFHFLLENNNSFVDTATYKLLLKDIQSNIKKAK